MHARKELSGYERIRIALEELGPTFIKLGQIMSGRPDLLPRELTNELKKLQDSVLADDFEEIKEVLKSEYNIPIKRIFKSIKIRPIASASIAQVHEATLCNGNKIALKIQRPNIEKTIKIDLEIIEHLTTIIQNRFISKMKLI